MRPTAPARIVVLVSGTGSNLEALLRACENGSYGAHVVAVGADRENIRGLEIAQEAGIPTFVRRLPDYATRDDWNIALRDDVAAYTPDIVVLAGFLKLLSADFLAAFPGRVINTHNALLPSFPGVHGPADALDYGVKITGATLFVVDPGVDTGPILAQIACPVREDDDADSLLERIKGVERTQLVETVGAMARRGWWIEGRHADVLT
ncbi:phosphoribosylglycinamide formyltransferase [Actinobaculum sp. 352]|nr:phosphoribosylglycinamide formyltransferase [Actinobaculum sp. 313]RTE50969.1 phosphoribosylglycinamide formyltransferase [Actinobaculum sp. 352]